MVSFLTYLSSRILIIAAEVLEFPVSLDHLEWDLNITPANRTHPGHICPGLADLSLSAQSPAANATSFAVPHCAESNLMDNPPRAESTVSRTRWFASGGFQFGRPGGGSVDLSRHWVGKSAFPESDQKELSVRMQIPQTKPIYSSKDGPETLSQTRRNDN
jgi:hypothetical protein